jgi:hypothetical protein
LTWLVPADAKLDDRLLREAVAWWRKSLLQRQPFCPSCRASYISGEWCDCRLDRSIAANESRVYMGTLYSC